MWPSFFSISSIILIYFTLILVLWYRQKKKTHIVIQYINSQFLNTCGPGFSARHHGQSDMEKSGLLFKGDTV